MNVFGGWFGWLVGFHSVSLGFGRSGRWMAELPSKKRFMDLYHSRAAVLQGVFGVWLNVKEEMKPRRANAMCGRSCFPPQGEKKKSLHLNM